MDQLNQMLIEVGIIFSILSVVIYYLWTIMQTDICSVIKNTVRSNNKEKKSKVNLVDFVEFFVLIPIILAFVGSLVPAIIYILLIIGLPTLLAYSIFKSFTKCEKETE